MIPIITVTLLNLFEQALAPTLVGELAGLCTSGGMKGCLGSALPKSYDGSELFDDNFDAITHVVRP